MFTLHYLKSTRAFVAEEALCSGLKTTYADFRVCVVRGLHRQVLLCVFFFFIFFNRWAVGTVAWIFLIGSQSALPLLTRVGVGLSI